MENSPHLTRSNPIFRRYTFMFLVGSIFLTLMPNYGFASQEIVIYSARTEHLIKPLFDAYQKDRKVKIRYVTDQAPALLERLKAEGRRSPADILFTVDAGNLWHAAKEGLLQPVTSTVLAERVPKHLSDSKRQWYGLSIRARTIVYHPDRVKPSELKNYQDLAESKWQGRLCLRTSQKVYNQSLVAMMIDQMGLERAEKVVKGWVQNLATQVFSNDNAVIQAVEAGQCDVGLVNSYYYAQLLADNPKLKAQLYWPKKPDGGTHVNISGAGLTRHAKNKAAATELLEWLVSDEAQKILAETNYEFPVVEGISLAGLIKSWENVDYDEGHLVMAGELQAEAVKLMDRVGYR